MELHEALHILAGVHTHADDRTGFAVEMGAMPRFGYPSNENYVEAWRTVRREIHLQTEPK